MFQSIGVTEWLIIIGLIIVLLVGGKKILKFFKGIVETFRGSKKTSKDSGEKKE